MVEVVYIKAVLLCGWYLQRNATLRKDESKYVMSHYKHKMSQKRVGQHGSYRPDPGV